jgi:protein FrlC
LKYGLISLDYRRYPLEKCFAAAKKYGFAAVELWGGRPHAWPPDVKADEVRAILALKQKYGIDIPMYTPNAIGLPVNLCSPMAVERAEGMTYHKLAVDAAAELGIPKMLVVADHPGHGADLAEIRRIFTNEIGELAHYAERKGVLIAVEPLTPMESPVITTSADCLELLRAVRSPALHFVLDIVPPVVTAEPLSNYFERLGDRVSHVHICNTDGKSDAHLELDNGILNIADVLSEIRACGYDGYAIVELYSVSLNDPERVVASSARVLGL